jgi:putative transposase
MQASVKKMEAAFSGFFRGKGFPKFKSKRDKQSFSCPNNTRRVDFNSKLLTIPKIKNIPIQISRIFEGNIKTVTISKTTTGKYYASILVDNSIPLPEKIEVLKEGSIGIDVGLKHFAVQSNGAKVENPKYLHNSLKRLACLQRRLARKQKGSKSREKARIKVARIHERITNQRNDFLHKLSTAITKQYDTVCIESLTVSNMVKSRNLARSISDVGWGEFFRQLKYKMDWKGGTVLQLPTFYPSSKRCSNCGVLNETLTLADRKWICPCGAEHDRDVNAAMNINNYHFAGGHPGIACGGVGIAPTKEAGR